MKSKFMKVVGSLILASLAIIMMSGCGGPKPTDTVHSFLTAFQKGDYKTASSYIENTKDNALSNFDTSTDSKDFSTTDIMKALATNYKFEKPEEVSKNDKTAKVKVKITSVDMQVVVTKTIGEVMPMAFASAFSDDSKSQQTIDALMESTFIKNMKSKDATMATREVTLNLKKDKNGDFKIVSDDHLLEAIAANYKSVDKMFNNN